MQLHYDLDKIIDRIKALKKVSRDFEVSDIIGLLAHDFSKRKKSGTLITPIVKWAIGEQIDLNWLLRGQKTQEIKHKCETRDQIAESESNKTLYREHGELLNKTREILQSETEYSNSLAANINSFHHAMENERRIDLIERKMELLGAENGRLKRSTILEKRKEERRKNDIPVENDRRSGTDRRKSAL